MGRQGCKRRQRLLTSAPSLTLLSPLYNLLLKLPSALFVLLVPLVAQLADAQQEVVDVFRAVVGGWRRHDGKGLWRGEKG